MSLFLNLAYPAYGGILLERFMSTFLLHEMKGLFKSIQRCFEGSPLSHGETFCPNMSGLFLADKTPSTHPVKI